MLPRKQSPAAVVTARAKVAVREGDYMVRDLYVEDAVGLALGEDLAVFDKDTFEKTFKVVQ